MGHYSITGRDMTQQEQYDLITNLIPLLNLAQLFYLSLYPTEHSFTAV